MSIEQGSDIPHGNEIVLENGIPGLRGRNGGFVPLDSEMGLEVFSDKTSVRIQALSSDIGAAALAGDATSDLPAGFWGIISSIDLGANES